MLGRKPEAPSGEPRDQFVHVRLTESERKEVTAARGATPQATFARDAILERARRGRK